MERQGDAWIDETWKLIQEDKKDHYSILMALMPLARMPQDKDSARSMQRYTTDIERMIRSLAPWQGVPGGRALKEKVGSGNVMVRLDTGDDPNDPLYKDAIRMKD